MPKRIVLPQPITIRLSPTEIVRFLGKVAIDDNGCWVWSGYVDGQGYGQFKAQGKAYWAHRLAFHTFCRRLRNSHSIDHKCHNPRCVNPDHLRAISLSDNIASSNRHRSKAAAEPAPF